MMTRRGEQVKVKVQDQEPGAQLEAEGGSAAAAAASSSSLTGSTNLSHDLERIFLGWNSDRFGSPHQIR